MKFLFSQTFLYRYIESAVYILQNNPSPGGGGSNDFLEKWGGGEMKN